MKIFHCRDAGFDCDEVIRHESEGYVMEQAARHAQEVHGVTMDTEMAWEYRSLIREE